MDTVLKTLADNEGRYVRELAEFVGIPSVSPRMLPTCVEQPTGWRRGCARLVR